MVAPEAVKDQSLDTLTSKLIHHNESKTNIIVELYRFHSIKQGEHQSPRDFVQLRKQASKCDFGETADNMVRDQVVIGVWDESTRKRLLANPKLILKQAISVLEIEEQVETDATYFHIMVTVSRLEIIQPMVKVITNFIKQVDLIRINVVGLTAVGHLSAFQRKWSLAICVPC